MEITITDSSVWQYCFWAGSRWMWIPSRDIDVKYYEIEEWKEKMKNEK